MIEKTSHRDGSFGFPQHMFWLSNKKHFVLFDYKLLTVCLYLIIPRGWGEQGAGDMLSRHCKPPHVLCPVLSKLQCKAKLSRYGTRS